MFRIYTNHDVIGCELGGALKNVVAIACGIAQGLGVGDNTRALVMTRGLAELTRLGVAMGGEAATFAGLAGMGDLVTTCLSPFSRNRTRRRAARPRPHARRDHGGDEHGRRGREDRRHGPRAGRALRRRHAGARGDLPRRRSARPTPPSPTAACAVSSPATSATRGEPTDARSTLDAIQRRVLWLAVRMVDHANRERPPGEIKVGGHQASSASMVGIMTALWFGHLGGDDKVAVKPHASPVYHAIKYLTGELDRSYLTRLRDARRAAVVPEPHEGPRRLRLLDRVRRPRRRRPAVRRRRRAATSTPTSATTPAGPVHRPRRRRRARRGQRLGGDHRPGAAGPRQRHAGSSTPTARASTASCPTRRSRS